MIAMGPTAEQVNAWFNDRTQHMPRRRKRRDTRTAVAAIRKAVASPAVAPVAPDALRLPSPKEIAAILSAAKEFGVLSFSLSLPTHFQISVHWPDDAQSEGLREELREVVHANSRLHKTVDELRNKLAAREAATHPPEEEGIGPQHLVDEAAPQAA